MGVLLRFSWIMIKVSVIVLFIVMDTVIIVIVTQICQGILLG